MTVLVGVLVGVTGLVVGLGVGAAAGAALVRRHSSASAVQSASAAEPAPIGEDRLVPGARAVLEALPVAVIVVNVAQEVLLANRAARDLGMVSGGVLAALPQLRRLVGDTRRSGLRQETELQAPVPRRGRGPEVFRARLAPVGDGTVAVLLENVTEARRVEAVRKDFVANVSHELKTPVGAMSLLAEAMLDASDDPAAVRRFAGRAQREAGRLARLVQELIDLSRLQGADPLPEGTLVSVDQVVAEAVDRTRTAAAARGITVVRGGDRGRQVYGSESQLVTAVGNLLDNAVAYSPDRTRIAVAVRTRDSAIEISVTDQGIGIAEKDLERVFERFYRADPARSRATGGTGLGLAIVKHVATNHGGEVSVWSVEGSGSTFTVRLPSATPIPSGGSAAPASPVHPVKETA